MLNSKLADWYFRLGSTSAHANQYQLHNLPCPAFAEKSTAGDGKMIGDGQVGPVTRRLYEELFASLTR